MGGARPRAARTHVAAFFSATGQGQAIRLGGARRRTPRAQVAAFFSATLPEAAEELARSLLAAPVRVTVGARGGAAPSVAQRLVYVGSEPGRRLALRELLAGGLAPPVLVFVASQQRAAALLGCAWPAGAQRADCVGFVKDSQTCAAARPGAGGRALGQVVLPALRACAGHLRSIEVGAPGTARKEACLLAGLGQRARPARRRGRRGAAPAAAPRRRAARMRVRRCFAGVARAGGRPHFVVSATCAP